LSAITNHSCFDSNQSVTGFKYVPSFVAAFWKVWKWRQFQFAISVLKMLQKRHQPTPTHPSIRSAVAVSLLKSLFSFSYYFLQKCGFGFRV